MIEQEKPIFSSNTAQKFKPSMTNFSAMLELEEKVFFNFFTLFFSLESN